MSPRKACLIDWTERARSGLTAGPGTLTAGQLLCNSSAGCIVVYKHDIDEDDDGDDH
jgi:hypothetical protein